MVHLHYLLEAIEHFCVYFMAISHLDYSFLVSTP